MTALGKRIRDQRVELGISQRDLAAKVGVGFPHISKIESGKENPSTELISKIAKALRMPADELILLADRVPEGLAQVLRDSDRARMFLREVKAGTINEADIERLLKRAKKR